jgi:hypothetical protein
MGSSRPALVSEGGQSGRRSGPHSFAARVGIEVERAEAGRTWPPTALHFNQAAADLAYAELPRGGSFRCHRGD